MMQNLQYVSTNISVNISTLQSYLINIHFTQTSISNFLVLQFTYYVNFSLVLGGSVGSENVNISENISIDDTVLLNDVVREVVSISECIGASWGDTYKDEIDFNIVNEKFLTDYFSMRYLADKNKNLSKFEIASIVSSISNLIRNATVFDFNEVFLGSLRLKRVKDSNMWVIVEF